MDTKSSGTIAFLAFYLEGKAERRQDFIGNIQNGLVDKYPAVRILGEIPHKRTGCTGVGMIVFFVFIFANVTEVGNQTVQIARAACFCVNFQCYRLTDNILAL